MSENEQDSSLETVKRKASEGEALVEVDNLKTYYSTGGFLGARPVKAVDGVSFNIGRGETVGLVGESGCGKTTLGRTLVRLEASTDGTVLFDGQDITEMTGKDLKQWRESCQVVFQDPESSLNSRMTVGEIVQEPLDVHGWKTKRERKERAKAVLEEVNLRPEHYYRYPHQFSGGQKQRIGIARAITIEPEFIVLDEPTSALDVSVQSQILNLLQSLQEGYGLTYLLISHDLSVVRHICDRTAVMYLGKIMEIGPTEQIFQNPQHPYTKSLLSAIPQPDPDQKRGRITLRGNPPSPIYPPDGCVFNTRCPMKIRPSRYRDLDQDVWDGIEQFREVIRERKRADKTLKERTKEMLGMETRFSSIDEIRQDIFQGLDVPREVQGHLDEASDYVLEGDEETALDYLKEEFRSDCEARIPEDHDISVTDERHQSHCHRHEAEFTEPEDVEIGVTRNTSRDAAETDD